MKQFIKYFKVSSWPMLAVCMAFTLEPRMGVAWTSAKPADVTVTVELAKEGPSKVTTNARYVVAGGQFHGFDLGELPGAWLVEEECAATLDDGRVYPLSFRRTRETVTRIALANGVSVEKGGVTFTLVHQIDFLEQDALRWNEGRAKFDWTPLVWDDGLDTMKVEVVLPDKSAGSPPSADTAISANYEVAVSDDRVELTKFRPVRWYPMQVSIDFDPALVPQLKPAAREKKEETPAQAVAVVSNPKPPTPIRIALLPYGVALLGFLALALKSFHVRRVFANSGIEARYSLFPATSLVLRVLLTFGALALGLAAEHAGSLAAGVPAFAAAAALWMSRREQCLFRMRAGGTWRELIDADISNYNRLLRAYRRSRLSMFDITTLRGIVSFAIVLIGLGYTAVTTRESRPSIGWACVIDGLILFIPAWFSSVRAELPIDGTLEGFAILKKRRRALSRMIGADKTGSSVRLWAREDEQGPIEVRLRAEKPPAGLNGLEAAGEIIRSGSLHKVRTVIVLRIEPGGETSERLSNCPNASEHHLTADMKEEIIVLRSRRGRNPGLNPLRAALALLPS